MTFGLDSFGFGYINNSATPPNEYFESLLNTFEEYPESYGYSQWANTTTVSLSFKGLGLPSNLYYRFSDLLSVLSKGSASCIWRLGGICELPKSCANYTSSGLWDFSFKLNFKNTGSSDYIIIPLVSLVADYTYSNGDTICEILVQKIDPKYEDSRSIILGGLVF